MNLDKPEYVLIKSDDFERLMKKLDSLLSIKRDKYLTMNELKDYLKVSDVTIYRYINELGLPTVKYGRQRRFKKEDVDRWIISSNIAHKR